jgi:hypothetical protein
MTRRVVLILVVIGALLLPGLLLASPDIPFPGRESGARHAAGKGDATAVDVAYATQGIELRIMGMLADDTATVISYTLRGRESEGTTAFAKAPPQIIDSKGAVYMVKRGSLDPNDRRAGTWVFPAIPAQAGTLTLLVEGIELGTPRDGQQIDKTDIQDSWRVQFAWNGRQTALGPSVSLPSVPTALGRGSLHLTSVKLGVTGTVISGTLEGFSSDTIQAMGCPVTKVTLEDGTLVPWISCRLGFGEGYRSFEVTFPDLHGQITVEFGIHFPDNPGTQAVPSTAKTDEGASASATLSVPQH